MRDVGVLALDYSIDVIACDNRSCREAESHPETCDCRCGSAGHGLPFRARAAAAHACIAARIARSGNVFLGAAVEDDEPMARIPRARRAVAWCAPCMSSVDDCDC